mgnify:CR=1 FL=1
MTRLFAERKLLYSQKNNDVRKEFIIRLSAPYFVRNGTSGFAVGDEGCFACQIEILGLNETYPEVYGADSLQAVVLASGAIEAFLKRLQKNYNLYHLTGESYF